MPRIAIAGGGLGGLTLARVLHVHGIHADVYERDTGPTARIQGGTLDLHPAGGQLALHEAGLTSGFRAIARPEGQDLVLHDHTGTLLLREDTPDDEFGRPEADRPALRKLLLDALPPETVHWGRAVEDITPLAHGHRLHLADGSTADCDLLVGADGARSRVRPLVTPAEPAHTGVNAIELVIPHIDRAHPALSGIVGRGSFMAIGPNRTLSAQRNGDGSARVHLTMRGEEDWFATSGIAFDDPATARNQLQDLYAGWAPEFLQLVASAEGPITRLPITALPVGMSWDPVPGVTLLGDAAHLMPPFAGAGANLAMLDGARLALALASAEDVRGFEEEMFARAAVEARDSAANLAKFLSPRGAQGVLELMRSLGAVDVSSGA
ncbi:NAD(P)/FAD-dependent oxidoreductase [Amycolatopsis sp. NPDC005232]|uniref:FAD-dependent oxidoreductase n=1 Tax=Amycolatopsis sp. NPDC005232 TaxID=3157027 RepID=UPI00339F3750